jgi:hypothetical protein
METDDQTGKEESFTSQSGKDIQNIRRHRLKFSTGNLLSDTRSSDIKDSQQP